MCVVFMPKKSLGVGTLIAQRVPNTLVWIRFQRCPDTLVWMRSFVPICKGPQRVCPRIKTLTASSVYFAHSKQSHGSLTAPNQGGPAETRADGTPQTLDSDKSGGLDSQEFCAAIRKLVFARSLIGSNTYSSAYENTYANTYSSAHSKPAIVSAFLLLMSLPTHYFLIIWWTDVSGIAKVCVQHCVSAPAPRSTLPRRSLFFSKQCSSFGFPLGGSQVIHEQTRSLQLRNHTLCSLLPRF